MQILLDGIRRAGLNKGRVRDALTGVETHNGVTGEMVSDPNCKNIAPLFLAQVHKGAISYRRITMEKPYARVGENGLGTLVRLCPINKTQPQIGVFRPHADEIVGSPETARWLRPLNAHGQNLSLIPISSVASWGKASDDLVKAVYQEHVLAVLALDRPSSHLAEQNRSRWRRSSRDRNLVRSRAHYDEYSLDFPPAGSHFAGTGFGMLVGGRHPGRSEPGQDP
jgi:branched-chain amino acid transport system substrate-binding protein